MSLYISAISQNNIKHAFQCVSQKINSIGEAILNVQLARANTIRISNSKLQLVFFSVEQTRLESINYGTTKL